MLVNRYTDPGCGIRLDCEDDPMTGPALDMGRVNQVGKQYAELWVRESGRGAGKSATIRLSPENVRDLRDGLNLLLVDMGLDMAVDG